MRSRAAPPGSRPGQVHGQLGPLHCGAQDPWGPAGLHVGMLPAGSCSSWAGLSEWHGRTGWGWPCSRQHCPQCPHWQHRPRWQLCPRWQHVLLFWFLFRCSSAVLVAEPRALRMWAGALPERSTHLNLSSDFVTIMPESPKATASEPPPSSYKCRVLVSPRAVSLGLQGVKPAYWTFLACDWQQPSAEAT